MSGDRRLERQIHELQRDMAALARHVHVPVREESEGGAVRDQMWKCKSCSSLLGFYNPDDDVMRVKYKDLMVFARAGGVRPEEVVASIIGSCELFGVEPSEDFIESIATRVIDSADLGFIQIICRGCGEINSMEYAPSTSLDIADGQ